MLESKKLWGAILLAAVCLFIRAMILQDSRNYINAYMEHVNRKPATNSAEAEADLEFEQSIARLHH